MDESNAEGPPEFTPDRYQKLIHAALSSKEEDFFQEYLGQKSPGLSDYLMPQGRFAQARDIRAALTRHVLGRSSDLTPIPGDPTVGQARSMFPGMPLPPGAVNEGMTPVPMSVVPSLQQRNGQPDWDIDSLQHNPTSQPFAGQRGPEDPFSDRGDTLAPPMPGAGPPSFYHGPGEGVTQVPTKTYNDEMLLPKSSQTYLAGQIHKESLRGFAPGQQLKSEIYQKWQALEGSTDPADIAKRNAYGAMLNMYKKGYTPGSVDEDIAENRRDITGVQAKRQGDIIDSQIEQRGSTSDLNRSKQLEIDTLLEPRRQLLTERTNLARKQATLAGDQSGVERAKLRTFLLHLMKDGRASGDLSAEDELAMTQEMLKGSGLEAHPDEASWLQKLLPESLRATPGRSIRPSGVGAEPSARPPALSPLPEAPPPPTDDAYTQQLNESRAFLQGFNTTQPDQVRVYQGKRYKRKGNQLQEVK